MAAAAIARRSVRSNSCCCCISRRYLFRTNNHSYYDYDYHVQVIHFSSKTPSANLSTKIQQPSSTNLFNEDYFVSKYQFSPQIASKIVSASTRMKNPQNSDLFLSFLQRTGFSSAHLDRIVRHHPNLLSSCPEKSVKPKLQIFHDLGFSTAEATQLIARDLNILKCGANRIIHSLAVYGRLLGSNDHVVKLIKKHSGLLYSDPEKTILPNIEFLKTYCGVQLDRINSLICTIPHFFTISPQNMRRCVHKVDEMGVDRTSKMFIYAAWAVCQMSDVSLKLKLKSFQDLGFSQDDILRLFRSYPMVVDVSIRKIKEVIEVLLETGKYDMSSIVNNPSSLTVSVEKRYKPRFQVLKALEEKSLVNKWPGLATLYTMSDKRFFEKFVAPNINDVGEDFIAKTSLSGKLEAAGN